MLRALLLSAVSLLALPGCHARQEGRALRGVVLVTCDTLRSDRLGLYGYTRPTSPNLDRFASEALVFDAAWSAAPLTSPSLSALLTGRLPEELGMHDNRNVLSPEASTLAEVLAARGIDTAAVVSNWVLRKRPQLPDGGVQQGFAHFDDRMDAVEQNRPDLRERTAKDTTDAALAWLASRTGSAPFFLWVHYQDPHGPYTPPDDCLGPVERAMTSEAPLEIGPDQRGQGALPEYQVLGDERRPEAYRMRYDAEIRFFDRELGRLLDQLRQSGQLEESLVIFTADHGESMGERGFYFSHGQHLYSELVHVPLVIHTPQAWGTRPEHVRTPVSHLDLWPTVLAALGLDAGSCRGSDLLGAALPPERVLPQSLRTSWSATSARYRLIVTGAGSRLYDIQEDPGETIDLAPREAEKVAELERGRQAFFARSRALSLQSKAAPLDAQEENELGALGYGSTDKHK